MEFCNFFPFFRDFRSGGFPRPLRGKATRNGSVSVIKTEIHSKIIYECVSGSQKTTPLVKHAFARVTPAIFVIFVDSRGLSSKAPVLMVRTQIHHFRRFHRKPPLFGGGQRHGLPKAPFWDPERRVISMHPTVGDRKFRRAGPPQV